MSETMNNNQIDNTDYYRLPSGRQLENFISERRLSFAEGSALKYLIRAGKKDGESAEKDRAKAEHFIRFIARYECVDEVNVRNFIGNLVRLAESDYKVDGFLSHHIFRSIAGHYLKAIHKHPYFCDHFAHLTPRLEDIRETLAGEQLRGDIAAHDVLMCEIAEMEEEMRAGNAERAVDEAYDAIAVLLRIIDVLEGRQKLGKPEENA